jgi:hypothetical protein
MKIADSNTAEVLESSVLGPSIIILLIQPTKQNKMGEGSDKQRRNEEWLWNLSCNI